jgi:hypothetical protein
MLLINPFQVVKFRISWNLPLLIRKKTLRQKYSTPGISRITGFPADGENHSLAFLTVYYFPEKEACLVSSAD